MRQLFVAVAAVVALWVGVGLSPVEASHGLPSDCAAFPVPHTYEARRDRHQYLKSAEVAGFNRIASTDSFFGTPTVEKGPRGARGVAAQPYVPPRVLKAIGYIESALAQADHSVYWRATGPTKISFDCGHGIMQITSGMTGPADGGWPSARQALVATHYLYNMGRGAAILVNKWNAAPEVRPVVGNSDPRVVENWYFALWGYNGFTGPGANRSNHPMDPIYGGWPRTGFSCGPPGDGFGHSYADYPYQELVAGCATRPPSVDGEQLWPSQPFTLPNLNHSLWSGPLSLSNFVYPYGNMDIPTPLVNHHDPTPSPPLGTAALLRGSPHLSVSPSAVGDGANTVTISNTGTGILPWRAKPQQSWISVNKKAGVALAPGVSCTPGYPCVRSPTLTINASAPPGAQGQVIIESLTNGTSRTVDVLTGVTDHFLTISAQEPLWPTAGGFRWQGVAGYVSAEPRPGSVPLYRLWNVSAGDHFYTTNTWVRAFAVSWHGYQDEGVAAYVSPAPGAGLRPLYQLWSSVARDHFYTTSTWERDVALAYGYENAGVVGYVADRPTTGTVPFFRWWNSGIADHFYTTRINEPMRSAGDAYRFEGVTAYVGPEPNFVGVPFYRLWNPTVGDHFYTADPAVRAFAIALHGYQGDGLAGYVSRTQFGELVPLYQLWNGAIGDHFYTTSGWERALALAAGYQDVGVAAYVAGAAAPGTIPLFEWWIE